MIRRFSLGVVLSAALLGACSKPAPSPSVPTEAGGLPCSAEIAPECDAGATDGCLDRRTTTHACVPEVAR